jgi:hypothetical protein
MLASKRFFLDGSNCMEYLSLRGPGEGRDEFMAEGTAEESETIYSRASIAKEWTIHKVS